MLHYYCSRVRHLELRSFYLPHVADAIGPRFPTLEHTASPRVTLVSCFQLLSPLEAASIWCCSVHTDCCERRTDGRGLPRPKKRDASTNLSRDTPCSLFVVHPGVQKKTPSKEAKTRATRYRRRGQTLATRADDGRVFRREK